MKKIFIITGILILCTVIFLIAFAGFDVVFLNLFHRSKVPKEYKNYHEINMDSSIRFGDQELTFLCKSFHTLGFYVTPANNLIVITTNLPKDQKLVDPRWIYNYYKLDANGEIVDTHEYVSEDKLDMEQIFGATLVNIEKDYFLNWPVDGNTERHPFIIQNEELTWSSNQQLAYFKKIREESDNYNIVYDGTNNKNNKSVKYFLKNQWYKLFFTTPFEQPNDNPFKEETFLAFDKSANLVPLYFQKTGTKKLYGSVGGGSIQSGSYYWDGNLFCNLLVNGDTLKFKTPVLVEKSLLSSNDKKENLKKVFESELISQFYYKNDNFKFSLLKNDLSELYIIKQVK